MKPRIRRVAAVAAGCSVALLAAACSSSTTSTSTSSTASGGPAVKGGTLYMLGQGDVDYMDPNISYYSIGYLGLRMWSRQLYTYPATPGKTTSAVPDLATAPPSVSSDGKTYTVTLRQGADWNTSPARQVTAQDVVRGVMRTCNPVQPFGGLPDYEGLIAGMTSFCNGFAKVPHTPTAIAAYMKATPLPGVVAKDDRTVVFTLTKPATYFTDMLTLPAFSPAPKEFDAYLPASSQLAQHTLSDGPYEIASYNPTKAIDFVRNPAWNAASDPIRKAYVDKIDVNQTVSQDSAQQQLETGTGTADMEWDDFPPPSQLPGLIAKKDPNLNLGITASTNPYVLYNTVSANNNKALANVKVRQALSYGINRNDVIQVLGGPTLNPPLTHVLPPNIVGGSTNFDPYPYNPTKAKSMLAAAGYPNGLTLKLLYRNSSQASTKAFQTIQQDLSKIGVKVSGIASPNADFYTKYLEVPSVAKRGVWDLALAGWEADWYGDAALSFFNPLFSGAPSYPPAGSNFGFYNDATTNALIAKASTSTTTDQAATAWAAVDHQVMADAPFFPLTSPLQANYHASQVHNAIYVPAIQNFDPTNVWLSAAKG